jgi:hypothetical protein
MRERGERGRIGGLGECIGVKKKELLHYKVGGAITFN